MKKWLIAHRGARCDGRENTLKAFEASRKYALGYVELDIHYTKDGKIICHHDFEVNGIKISSHTYEQLKQEDPELITFDQAIKVIGDKIPLVIHIKPAGLAKRILKVLVSNPQWVAGSFNIEELIYLRKKGIAKDRLYLFQHGEPMTQIGRAVNADLGGIGINHGYVSPIWYWRARRHGLNTYVWTVNLLLQAWLFRIFYPHLKICSDRIDLMQKLN